MKRKTTPPAPSRVDTDSGTTPEATVKKLFLAQAQRREKAFRTSRLFKWKSQQRKRP
jgi:hypothetical protein